MNRYEVTISAATRAETSDDARRQVEAELQKIRSNQLAIYVESVRKTSQL